MKMPPLSHSCRLPRWRGPERSCGSLPPLGLVLLVAGCASSAPALREANLSPFGSCSADRLMHELVSRYPGMRVERRGDDLRVHIRGSLQEPLYILDGMPLAPASGVLSAVHPCDIERIQVLSDPAELTFFGLRGANGVVLITTKRRQG